jgi:hypothetical protein
VLLDHLLAALLRAGSVWNVWDVGLLRFSGIGHDVAHLGLQDDLLLILKVGLLAAVGFLADWVQFQSQVVLQVWLGDLAQVGSNVGFEGSGFVGVANLVGNSMGDLVWSSLVQPLVLLLHNLLDDFVSILLALLGVPDAGLQDWLKGLLESLLDGWSQILGAFLG